MQLNGALFYYDYKNQQFLDTYTANGVLLYREVNAPKSRVVGGEVELLAKATDDLEVRANIGVQDSQYLEFISKGEDVSGNQLAMSPKVTMSGGFDWRVASIQAGDFRVGADAFYYARQFYDPANTARIAQGGYAVFNAHLEALLGAKRQYTITIWGKNLGNKEYITYALATQQPSQGGLGLDYTIPAEPRTYGLTASVHF
jgi:outer membrane receptor protein involved in Fe transport